MLFRREAPSPSENPSTATARFVPVTDSDAVEELFGQSWDAPVLLFKHDPHCAISLVAHHEVAQLQGEMEIPTINVARDKAAAREVATRTEVAHESPQVLLLHQGRAVWTANHWAITADTVATAVAEYTPIATIRDVADTLRPARPA